jgi:internalin A
MFRREPSNSVPLHHRWLRFSLRTILVVVTVFGVWLGVKVDQARRQKRAIESLSALGAQFWFEHQRTSNGGFDGRIELHVPAWARELCGDDFFQTVRGVYVRRRPGEKVDQPRQITDEDLKYLADLPHLEVLQIVSAPISDVGLAHVVYPERLREVTLSNTNIANAFLRRLRAAKRLESLWLDNTRVTDDGLTELYGITSLRRLSLSGTQSGDRGLAVFSKCRRLESLKLGTKVTNDGFQCFETLERIKGLSGNAHISGEAFRGFRMPKVDEVYLSNSAVSDDNLPPLVQSLRGVRVLNLGECAITDRGLQHLKELGKTQILLLSNTRIQGRELQQLSSLSGLAMLVLSGCPLDDADLKGLEPLYTGAAPGGNLTLNNTPVSDDDLAKLSGFANLLYLGLAQTKVTDRGLPHVYSLKKLLRIDLRSTRVTTEGVRKLQQANPGLKVAWNADPQPPGWRR